MGVPSTYDAMRAALMQAASIALLESFMSSNAEGEQSPAESGELPGEEDELFLYNELRRLAARRLRSWSPGDSLNATALVNEAYLKISRSNWARGSQVWNNKSVFFSVASEAMRQILIDHHRKRISQKRGGGHIRLHIEIDALPGRKEEIDILALSEALDEFEALHPTKAVLVKLRYFGGLSMPECAAAIGVSVPTAERHWRYARAWLADYLDRR